MTRSTFETLAKKADKFKELVEADKIDWGHHDAANSFFIEVTGAKKSAQGTRNGETGHFIHFFETTRAMHLYLNDKIRLFGGKI